MVFRYKLEEGQNKSRVGNAFLDTGNNPVPWRWEDIVYLENWISLFCLELKEKC